ncbi:MAG: VWA domain-containing protein [Chitinispirillaceae bacterium]|nr:VWA domain-containing protein [Chitinispirillaceae bacterium]
MVRKAKRISLSCLLILIFSAAVFADGFIIVPHHDPRPSVRPVTTPYPLEVRYHRVETAIEEMGAVTSVDQEFYNPTGRRLEGYYLFPIPANAVIGRFSMYIDGKETEAELLDAKKARAVYEDLVRRIIDPALLEYYGRGMFKARIFPIEPRSTKRVKISYKETLEKNNGTIGYVYPLNTEKFSAAPLKDVSVKVSLKTRGNLKSVYCPSHEAEIVRKSRHQAVIGYEAKNVRPDRDFYLYYSTDDSKFGISLLTYREAGDEGFFFLNISPDYDIGKSDIEEKDITFVLDVSGSMAGKKLEQAKRALRFCVANLNAGDRFDIVRFSTEAEALFGKPAAADDASRKKAEKFIDNLKAIGGTNIEEALRLALAARQKDGRPYTVLFLTDGKPTIGKTGDAELLSVIKNANSAKTRIFTFGIGDEINTHLLDKITEATNAYRTYVTPEEDIEIKVSDLYTKIQSPVFTGLAVDFGKTIDAHLLYPKELPDLFRGSSITLLGRYRGHGTGEIVLSGTVRGKGQELAYKAEFPESDNSHEFIAPLWAARRIGFLLDQIRLNGEDRELVDEVTQLAKSFGIVTPYTSYLILEDEDRLVRQNRMREDQRSFSGFTRKMAPRLAEESKMEFEALRAPEGAPAARASSELQEMHRSTNIEQMLQGKKRMEYKDKAGSVQNVTQQVKNILGRAFYNNGAGWMDVNVQKQKKEIKKNRVQFASAEYFDLLKKFPQAAQFMSLGKNVSFVMNSEVWEIYE